MATNLLTSNQATGTDTLGTTVGFDDAGECTIASTTEQAAQGSRSLKLTSTSTSSAYVYIPYAGDASFPTGTIAVTPGNTYSAFADGRKASGATALYLTVLIYWYKSDGYAATTAYNEGSGLSLSSSAWGQASVTATAPVDAAYATMRAVFQSSITNGNSYYLDKLGFVAGSDTTWSDPGGAGAISPGSAAVTVAGAVPQITSEQVAATSGPAAITFAAPAPSVSVPVVGSPVPPAGVTFAAPVPLVLGSTGGTATATVGVFVATAGSPTHYPSPSWTDLTSRVLAEGGVTAQSGVSGRGGQEWAAGSFSLTLRNTDGAYSGPALLRRPLLLRRKVGTSTVDLRLVVTDVVEYRDGVRRLVVTGTDMLGLAADLEVGQTWDEQMVTAGVTSRWLLTADGSDSMGTAHLSEDPVAGMAADIGGDYSGQTPVYGTIDGCPALSGGGVSLEPVADTGFRGLFGLVPGAAGGWTWSGWVRVPDVGQRPDGTINCVLAVTMTTGLTVALTYNLYPMRTACQWNYLLATMPGYKTSTAEGSLVLGDWQWVTYGMTAAGVLQCSIRRADGTLVTSSTAIETLPEDSRQPAWVTLGGLPAGLTGASAFSPTDRCPALVQVADATWSPTPPDLSAPLLRGHIGYPGETVSARAARLLTEAGIMPTGTTWNGTTPPAGPALGDVPLTRRPLADALNETLDSGGYVPHELPAAAANRTTIGLLYPDSIDGYGVTPVSYAGTRVMVASDGVTTNTGMLTNAATVTQAQTQAQVTHTDTASVATYGRRSQMVTSWALESDYRTSHASWLARRAADPTQALGLPDLVLDVDGMVADGHAATVVAMAKTGACVNITAILPGGANYAGIVRGVQWQQTPQGAARLTLRCQPLRPLTYALLDDDATATLDNVILGW